MVGEWPRVPLGDLVQNFDSRRVPLSSRDREKRRGPYPYYGATGVMDYVDDYLFEGLHLLIAEDGSVETTNGKPFLQLVAADASVRSVPSRRSALTPACGVR
jgi:type I restriction enzyme S subunit